MALNPSRLIPGLIWLYSGICRYFPNASCHAASLIGGATPRIGCHSVIDRPEPVRRVAPPTTTIANTSPAIAKSQMRTGLSRESRLLVSASLVSEGFASHVITNRTSAGFSIDVGYQRTDVKA